MKEFTREEYRKTDIYIRSLNLIKDFIDEILDGDIEKLRDYSFEKLENKKYIGNIKDPDMYTISQAIYIVLWGWYYNLNENSLGSWGISNESQFPYRGDTMNSFNTVFGDNLIVAKKYYELSEEKVKVILEFHYNYHKIGNFIVIPNINNINKSRAIYNGLKDYFDWFLIAIYKYQCNTIQNDVLEKYNGLDIFKRFEQKLKSNNEYAILDMIEFKEVFYLNNYFKDDIPQPFIDVPPEIRLKEYKGRKRFIKYGYFDNSEYEKLVSEYLSSANAVIEYRTGKIIEQLKTELSVG